MDCHESPHGYNAFEEPCESQHQVEEPTSGHVSNLRLLKPYVRSTMLLSVPDMPSLTKGIILLARCRGKSLLASMEASIWIPPLSSFVVPSFLIRPEQSAAYVAALAFSYAAFSLLSNPIWSSSCVS
jgi:hypothetical protein